MAPSKQPNPVPRDTAHSQSSFENRSTNETAPTRPSPDEPGAQLVRHLLQSRPPLTPAELERIVGSTRAKITPDWSQEQEDSVVIQWDVSIERRAYRKTGPADRNFLQLWNVCLQLYRESPTIFISPLFQLRCQPLLHQGQLGRQEAFSQAFCDSLAALMAHPFWQGSIHRLAMALQYTVICRLDDRRRWKFEPGACEALRVLEFDLNHHDEPLSASVHTLHKDARENAARMNSEPSDFSNFLYHLGEFMRLKPLPRAPKGETNFMGFEVYPVSLKDLKCLIVAVETFDSGSRLTTDRALEVFNSFNRPGINSHELRSFVDRAGKELLRRLTRLQVIVRTSACNPTDLYRAIFQHKWTMKSIFSM
ncbi:hypothetical protein IL306_009976 [Fusarium sp. DS 682]|nr:hypothetical protein IL306_009976 [Fusarium sp. DS 682]